MSGNYNFPTLTRGDTLNSKKFIFSYTSTTKVTSLITALTSGLVYTIASVGNSDFTAIGAEANVAKTTFVASGAGTGTGTATLVGSQLSIVSARAQIRTSDDTLVHTWSSTIVSPNITISGGQVTLALVPAVTTAAFDVGTYVYDLELTLTNGETLTVITGQIPVIADITRTDVVP
jgi:hypothetical protein